MLSNTPFLAQNQFLSIPSIEMVVGMLQKLFPMCSIRDYILGTRCSTLEDSPWEAGSASLSVCVEAVRRIRWVCVAVLAVSGEAKPSICIRLCLILCDSGTFAWRSFLSCSSSLINIKKSIMVSATQCHDSTLAGVSWSYIGDFLHMRFVSWLHYYL